MAHRLLGPSGLVAAAFAAMAAHSLGGCGSSQTNSLAPPPRPPDPAQLTLTPIRVTRASWVNTLPGAPTPDVPTGRGRNRRPPAAPSMTPELATSVLMTANEPVRACYRGLLVISPQAAGSITTLMRVNPDGTVSDVERIGTPDASLTLIEPCVLNAVRTRRFPPTRSSTLLSFPFVLRSGEVGVASGPNTIGAPVENTRPRPGEMQIVNPDPITVRPWRPTLVPNTNPVRTLTRDMAAEVAPDITSLVDTCYSGATVMVPGLAGQFGLRIAVEPSGNVSRVEVQDQGLIQGPLRECLLVLGGRLKFHSSGGGALISVDVTLAQSEAPAAGAAGLPGVPGAPGIATVGAPTAAPPAGGLLPVPSR